MKPAPRIHAASRFLALLLCLGQVLMPLPALAASPVELATSPMATSTTTTVKPNLMFVLDDSGSMDWDYLPDTAKNFAGKYGYNSAQCNGNFYNPNVTYDPPVDYTGAPLNATPTSFTAAYKDGYNTAAGTVNLSSGFTGGSGSGASGISLPAQAAFYYIYTGSQTTNALKNYFSTSSTFYTECNSDIGSTPGSGVFRKARLSTTATTDVVFAVGAGGGATFTISGTGSRGKVTGITVGGSQIMATAAGGSRSETNTSLAGKVVTQIKACTTAVTGACAVSGYDASSSGAVVTITGPAVSPTSPVVSTSGATATVNTGFWRPSPPR